MKLEINVPGACRQEDCKLSGVQGSTSLVICRAGTAQTYAGGD